MCWWPCQQLVLHRREGPPLEGVHGLPLLLLRRRRWRLYLLLHLLLLSFLFLLALVLLLLSPTRVPRQINGPTLGRRMAGGL
jgi:hypothetical protein